MKSIWKVMLAVCCLGMAIGCGTNPSKNENVKETLPALVVKGTQLMIPKAIRWYCTVSAMAGISSGLVSTMPLRLLIWSMTGAHKCFGPLWEWIWIAPVM